MMSPSNYKFSLHFVSAISNCQSLLLRRRAIDLEPLQPLIKKFIGFLETEAMPSFSKTSRPRAELDRVSIWLGIKSLYELFHPNLILRNVSLTTIHANDACKSDL